MSEIDERVDSSSKQLESDNDSGPLNQLVYVPDSKDGYALGRIFDLDTKHVTIRLEQPRTGDVKVEFTDIWPAVDDLNKDVNDNCSLMYLNEATLLHNCRLRYNRKQIYVSAFLSACLISIFSPTSLTS
jgi:myosin-6